MSIIVHGDAVTPLDVGLHLIRIDEIFFLLCDPSNLLWHILIIPLQ